jgi:hypothetical protein
VAPRGRRRRSAKQETKAAIDAIGRKIKRDMIDNGLIADPSKRAPRHRWAWQCGEPGDRKGGIVAADTRSQARALIKKEMGLKPQHRLPVGIQIEIIGGGNAA